MATEEVEVMDFEEDLFTSSCDKSDKFDTTVGHIEEIIMEDEFQKRQQEFMDKYYLEFEDTEENKFIYTDIHKSYTELVEKYLEEQLLARMPEFSMQEFSRQLEARKEELEGEVFEILMTFTDFLTFKEMFLDYRKEKEGCTVDLSDALTVTSVSTSMTSGLSLEPSLVGLSSGDSLSSDPDPSGQ